MTKTVLGFLLLAAAAFAQSQPVAFYDASNNLQYICKSQNQTSKTTTTWAISDSTLTSVAIVSNVATVTTASAHNLYPGAYVSITGSTSGTIDGSFTVLTAPTSTTFTLSITTANATFNNAGLTVYTKSPLLTAQYWSITHLLYDTGNKWVGTVVFSDSAKSLKCSDRALY